MLFRILKRARDIYAKHDCSFREAMWLATLLEREEGRS